MRTITLLVASILLTVNVTKANETKSFNTVNTTGRFNIDEPISFTERGIEFFVFQNGDFDFNTRPQDSQGGYYFKTAGKRGGDATTDRGPRNNGVIIERDAFGRIRRVGNTFINYDSRDRVSRIGSVFMTYNRIGLTQIGGMKLIYDRRGNLTDIFGSVKGFQSYEYAYNNHGYYGSHNDDENHNNGYASNNYNSNNDYYYYKTDGTRAKVEENK